MHGDVNETFFVGEVDEASRLLVNTTRECLEQAIAIGINLSLIVYHDYDRGSNEEGIINYQLVISKTGNDV